LKVGRHEVVVACQQRRAADRKVTTGLATFDVVARLYRCPATSLMPAQEELQ